ncbi:helicase-related protein [Capnocytophaga canis]|uniref:helicase-related protein n=1 Tax=Capnocytophaga canis TaxID=1848903 RepID=UPI0015628965|nr:helicase-related protein [Capnocytophaga canis]
MSKKISMLEMVSTIVDVIKNGNPQKYYINNKGLSELGAILFYPKENQIDESKELHKLLKETFPNEIEAVLDSLKKYHFTSYYTPKEVIDFQIDILKENNIEPKTILEPSAGNGAYVEQLKKIFPYAQIVALEPDMFSYQVLKANNLHSPNVETINTTFEDYFLENKDKKFDLVISNIPFGDFSIKTPYKHDYITNVEKNVNIFFNRYMPEMVNENGHCFILTSKNFLDRGKYTEVRQDILKQNEFVENYRFNNKLFEKENTKVVTDLTIYRKNSNRPQELSTKEKSFLATTNIELDGKEFPINQYVNEQVSKTNGDYKIGFFHNKEDITIIPNEKENLHQFLDRQLNESRNLFLSIGQVQQEPNKSVSKDVKVEVTNNKEQQKQQSSSSTETLFSLNLTKDYLINNTNLYKGTYNVDPDTGKIKYYKSFKETFDVKDKKKALLLNTYIPLRNEIVLLELNSIYNKVDSSYINQKYNDIQYMIDMFRFQYGSLGDYKDFLSKDHYFDKLYKLLEYKSGQTIQANPNFKVDYFLNLLPKGKIEIKKEPVQEQLPVDNSKEQSTITDTGAKIEPVNYNQVTDLKELCYNFYDEKGYIDIHFFAEKLGKTSEEILEQGFKEKLFFLNPIRNENNQFVGFVPELFFRVESGNIDEKIYDFQNFKSQYEIDTSPMIKYLESIKNERLDIEHISFNFESFFVPIQAKNEFLREATGERVTVVEEQFSSSLNLHFERQFNSTANEKYSVKDKDGIEIYSYKKLLQDFADNKYPIITKSHKDNDGKTISVLDKEGTLLAQNLYEQVHLEFKSFITENAKYKDAVERAYYHYFLAEKNIKTTDQVLKFPDTIPFEPYKHQKEAVMFSLLNKTALLDHEVGHGKTLTMGMLGYKLIQQNKAQKVLISTMKAIAPQFEKETKDNFPMLKIFRLDDKNFSKKNREKTLEHIRKSDYDIVICEHTHLARIPKDEKYVQQIYQEKINMIDKDLEVAEKYGTDISKKIIKGLVKRKDTLQGKLDALLQENIAKNGDVSKENTFSKLGFDALMVDECHEFKNIGYTTRHERVSGLNAREDKGKNLDLEITIASIHDKKGRDSNVFFFSGTPIKNSVTELYAYQRYLQPAMLKNKNIHNFDAWASVFLKQSVKLESDILGNPKINSRFRYFTNMPELSKMYHSMSHISNSNTFKTHKLSVNKEFITLDITPKLEELKVASSKFANSGDQEVLLKVAKYEEHQMKGAHVLALGINRRILVDPLIEKDNVRIHFDENDQIKINKLCEDVKDLYNQTTPHKGVCLVFSDVGVWSKQKDYNTYDTIKNILSEEYNIPKEQIGIAQEYKEKNKTQEFQEKIRNGEIRIAIGSTSSLGTGLNIQKRAVGVFHLDIPFSPDAYIQRLGRALRAGNEIAQHYGSKIVEKSYGIKDTTDIFSYSLNGHKEKFLSQLRDFNTTTRIYDDVLTEEKDLSHSQREAALIGDMKAFKLSSLEDDLKALEAQKQLFDITKNNAEKKIGKYELENKQILKEIIKYEKLQEKLLPLVPDISKVERNENYDKKVEAITYEAYKNILSKEDLAKYGSHTNFKEFSKGIHNHISHFGINDTEKRIFSIYKNDFAVKFNIIKGQNNSGNTCYRYEANVEIADNGQLSKFRLYSKNLMGISDKNIPFQLFKIINEIPKYTKELKSTFDYNLKTIENNKENLKRAFPIEKEKRMEQIKSEIKEIKKSRIKI